MARSSFNPTSWVSGVTVPQLSDYQGIYSDLYSRGTVVDGGGYGRANTSYIVLLPGALPGTTYSVSAPTSWAGGVATLTIGAHSISVNQRVSVASISPSGYNTTTDSVVITAVTGTTISYALGSNPGTYSSGGTVLVDGVSPVKGMTAINAAGAFQVWNGTAWQNATTTSNAPVWWIGSGAPASGTGNINDMYLDSAAGNIYGPKATGGWGSIQANITGPTGYSPKFITGAGVPASGTGNNGDMYINSSTQDLYGPKTAGAWGSIVDNIKGATGTAGNTEPVNNQTGTTYPFANTDGSKLVTFSNSSAIAATIGQAGTGGNFAAAWYADVQNRGTGILTITPTTSTIDGQTTLVLSPGQGARIVSDGTNYYTFRGMGAYTTGSQLVAPGSGITTTLAATYNELLVKVDCTNGPQTIQLYGSVNGNKVHVKKIDSSTNAVTITTGTGQIDDGWTPTISAIRNGWSFYGDGSNWETI